MPSLNRQDQVNVNENAGYQRHRRIIRDVTAERRQLLYKVTQLIELVFAVLEIVIGLRVILRLIAADPNNAFASLIYRLSYPWLQPFLGLTNNLSIDGAILEVPAIIAMITYALIGWLIIRLVWLIFYHPGATVVSTYEKRKMD
jgi:hypothetical protein